MTNADDNAKDTMGDARVRMAAGVWIARGDLHFSFSRSGGPGGQAVNKVSTRAQMRVPLAALHGLPDDAAARLKRLAGRRITADGELLITAETFRSQLDNRRACLERLRAMVAAALVRPKVRKVKKPTRSMIERRLRRKRLHSEKKQVRRSRRQRFENE